jgi:hypothetical protein
MKKFTIYNELWPKAEKKLKKLQSKAKQLGFPVPEYTAGEPYEQLVIKNKTHPDTGAWAGNDAHIEIKREITLISEPIKIEGWEFLGTVERSGVKDENEKELNLFFFKDREADIESYKELDFKKCDHCNHRRYRKKVFIVQNEESKEVKVIGSTCVKDFLQTRDPEWILQMATWMVEMEEMEERESGSYSKPVYIVKDVLELAAQAIINFNYKNAQSEMSTKRRVENACRPSHKDHPIVVTEEAEKMAADALERIKNLSEKQKENQFNHNMWTISQKEFIEGNHLGIACYIVEHNRKEVCYQDQKKKEREGKLNEHFGEIKKRYTFRVKLVRANEFENQFGGGYYMTFEDEQGRTFEWKSSSYGPGNFVACCGGEKETDFIDFKGTVSYHGEWDGIKKTSISRCKPLTEKDRKEQEKKK